MRHLDAGLDLLDRQIVDCDGTSLGKVDDVEIEMTSDGRCAVTALLLGPQAQGPRVGGHVGRWMARFAATISGEPDGYRIPVALVEDFGVSVRLRVTADALHGFGRVEQWLDDNFISRIPGGRRASG